MTQTGSMPRSTAQGLSVPDLLLDTLSEQQKPLLLWMRREREVIFEQVVVFLQQSPEAAEDILQSLIDEDIVQVRRVAGESRYRARLAPKSGSQLPERIQKTLLPGNPLGVLPNPSGLAEVLADGSDFQQRVTITNKGSQAALIDVVLMDADDSGVVQWCHNPHERLALGPQQSSEVCFDLTIPAQALPSTYRYRIVVDAQEHYPEAPPVVCEQRLQVLTAISETSKVTDPTFTVSPATSSTQPFPLLPGATLPLQIQIHNRGDRVDRFRITCPDLDTSWYEVDYPEGLVLPGLVMDTDGLPLNPGAKGTVTLRLHPPEGTEAGAYFPTISLHSVNSPDTQLLDVVYLTVLPVQDLLLEWNALRDTVRQEVGEYLLRIANQGNCDRTVAVSLLDPPGRKPYTYRLSAPSIRVASGTEAYVGIQVKPGPWWRRPWFGGGHFIPFEVRLKDVDNLPLSPVSYQGSLLWQPRPWWQLLLALAGLGLIGTLLLAIWLLFLKPPAPPKILSLQSTNATYEAANDEAIQLNWRIRSPQRLGTLQLVGRTPDGSVLSPTVSYSFANGIPARLEDFCQQVRRDLVCQNVPTDARLPGDYVFELSAFLKQKPDEVFVSETTDTIQLLPIQQPKVTELAAAQQTFPDTNQEGLGTLVPMSWTVTHPDQLQILTLLGRRDDNSVSSQRQEWNFSQGIPDELKLFCTLDTVLTCKDVLVRVDKAGATVFTMTALPQTPTGDEPNTRQSDPVIVEAVPPEIRSFQVNGQEAGPGYLVELDRNQPIEDIAIAWDVAATPGTKVELLPAPGPVNLQGAVSYTLSQQSGKQTITLKVTPETGEPVTRSFNLEVFDASLGQAPSTTLQTVPLPALPGLEGTAPGNIPTVPLSPVPGNAAETPGAGDFSLPVPPTPRPIPPAGTDDALTPTEIPPQFD